MTQPTPPSDFDPWAAGQTTITNARSAVREAQDAIIAESDREAKLATLSAAPDREAEERMPAFKNRRTGGAA